MSGGGDESGRNLMSTRGAGTTPTRHSGRELPVKQAANVADLRSHDDHNDHARYATQRF